VVHLHGPRNRIFVDLISRALGAQTPNPGSGRSRAKCEIFDFVASARGMHYTQWLCINRAFVTAGLVLGKGPRKSH
jgi:hypothetical protein